MIPCNADGSRSLAQWERLVVAEARVVWEALQGADSGEEAEKAVLAWSAAALPYRAAWEGLRRFCGIELSLSAAQDMAARWGQGRLARGEAGRFPELAGGKG